MANAQLQALQYIQNKFGREGLILGGHCFRVKNRHNDRVYWRCSIPATVNKINKIKKNCLHIYILKRNYTVKKNLLYTHKQTYLEQTIQFYGQ